MARIIYELNTIVGQYTNAAGEQKNRYQRIGSIIETKKGLMFKLDVMPFVAGGWEGWGYVNDSKPKEGEQPQQRSRVSEAPPYDDDPPF